MAKKKSSKSPGRSKPGKRSSSADVVAQRSRNVRETIESIAIAFILAFLFRTFEAEAFVIPTGSMAPTLQGRHKDVHCPQCGFRYQSSASAEVDARARQNQNQRQVVRVVCPMCRYPMTVDPHLDQRAAQDAERVAGAHSKSYNGDRILVGKFVYEFSEPRRWDVIVFKYPGDTKMNYIKRLVGLPNEDLMIRQGDVYTRSLAEAKAGRPRQIARKPPDKVWAMKQAVADTHYLPKILYERNWPLRWQAVDANGGWQAAVQVTDQATARQTFSIAQAPGGARWLRYHHLPPSEQDWQLVRQGPLPADHEVRPQLITDFYAYNTFVTREEARNGSEYNKAGKLGLHWVGDLILQADVQVQSDSGRLLLDLIEGGIHFQCAINVASGDIEFTQDGQPLGAAKSGLQGPGTYRLAYANVDNQLLLWSDGEVLAQIPYEADNGRRPKASPDDPGDLAPVGVGSAGVALQVDRLQVFRDIYYIADEAGARGRPITDYDVSEPPLAKLSRERLRYFLSDPSQWDVFENRRTVRFEMLADEFFVLGDNSPFSKDSRLWGQDGGISHFVPRKLLIGKAICIYWPHSWDRLPYVNVPFPLFPNFADMGLVR